MLEMSSRLDPEAVADRTLALLMDESDLTRRRSDLLRTMPRAGAARALLDAVFDDLGWSRAATMEAAP